MAKVTRKDRGMNRLRKGLRDLKHYSVTVDFGSQKHPEADLSVASLAAIHEYGTAPTSAGHPGIPSRPAIRRAAKNNERALARMSQRAIASVIDGKDPVDAFEAVAKEFRKFVIHEYETARSWAVPLAPATVERKGHDKPLDASGFLIDHIGWSVRFKGRFVRRGK